MAVRAKCVGCGGFYTLNPSGVLRIHGIGPCWGSREKPVEGSVQRDEEALT